MASTPPAEIHPYEPLRGGGVASAPFRFPVMSDGRQFTDYTPRCSIARPAVGVSSHDYKDSLIRDANKMMSRDRAAAAESVGVKWNDAGGALVPGAELLVDCNDRACSYTATGNAEPVGISVENTRMGV